MLRQKSVTFSRGFTLTELMVALLLIGLAIAIVLGLNASSARTQKTLLYTARQFSADVQNGIQQAKARSSDLYLELNATNYRIYRENGASPGFQSEDELLLEKQFSAGITVQGSGGDYPDIPQEWGDPSNASDIIPVNPGTPVRFSSRGFSEETAFVFYLSSASHYKHVCVHLFLSGDSEIVRSGDSNSWQPAPPG